MEDMETTTPGEDAVYQVQASPDFNNDGIVFAARQSGLYRSSDGGDSWQYAFGSLNLQEPLAITALGLSPNFSNDRHVFAAAPGGILRSTDGGENWTIAMLPTPPPYVSALAISPDYTQDGTVLAGTIDDGIFRSTNRGASWSAWNFGLFDMHVLCIAISPGFAKDRTIVLGTESCVFMSTNAGLGWRELDFPIQAAPVLSLAISTEFPQDGGIFAGTESSGLFHSRSFGKDWELLAPPEVVGSGHHIVLSPQYPSRGEMLIVNPEDFLLTSDFGQSWESWMVKIPAASTIMTVAAPEGIGIGATIFTGLSSGEILSIKKQT